MRQEYSVNVHEYTSYDESCARLQTQVCNRSAQHIVAENARAQELKEQQTSELAPGAYMMSKIVENNGTRYRSGRGENGRYMTTDDYASLYRSRRVCHVNEDAEGIPQGDTLKETQHSRVAAQAGAEYHTARREQPVRSVRESGYSSRPATASVSSVGTRTAGTRVASRQQTTNAQSARRTGKAPMSAQEPSARKAPTTPVVRREQAVSEWLPSGERYIRVRNQKRFPLAMVMMIIAVSVSLMLIVFGSVMTSHMEREVCALNNELAELNDVIEELEGELALKNDPLKMEQLAKELGMVRGEYVQTRLLQTEQEEHVVVYAEEEHQTISLATLLSAIGFFKN